MKKIRILLGLIILSIIIMSLNVNSAFVLKNSSKDINAYKNQNLIRLHVIANSNSPQDQYIKRKIRDKVQLYMGKFNSITVLEKKDELKKLKLYIDKFLEDNGFYYKSRVEFGSYYFPVRTYDDLTLPAGKYRALKIVLGKGKGSNWWCVLLPPMCIENKELAGKNGSNIEIRFKIIEWLNKENTFTKTIAKLFNFDQKNKKDIINISYINKILSKNKYSKQDEIILSQIVNELSAEEKTIK